MTGWTFQSLIDGGMNVRAYCHDPICNYSRDLDLVKLRDRFGPDAPAMAVDLADKMKCSKCGGKRGKGVGLIYSPAGTPRAPPVPRRNPYAKAKGE